MEGLGTRTAWVPSLEITSGQPVPVAANGGLSFASLERDGDAGTGAAIDAALEQIARGHVDEFVRWIDDAPAGPVETKWGTGFRTWNECMDHIRAGGMEAPDGGVVLPLCYTVYEHPSYSVVSSNFLWQDSARRREADLLRRAEESIWRSSLYFPQVLRDAHRIGETSPGLSVTTPECMDRLGVSLAHLDSTCTDFYDAAEVERVFYPEIEQLLLDFFPDATDALVYNHDIFNRDYDGPVREDQDAKDPGVNTEYANLVHNDLNDNSGRVRCRELLTQNLRNFGREQHYTEAEADAKMSRRFMSINLAKPFETVEQYPFILCAWPSFADQPYITNYRVYDDRVGETTLFTYRPDHDWYWFPRQKPNEISMLKCYDSITDGSVSRWSFHSACFDPGAPPDAPCRKNIVVRTYVFF